ncbi:NACHT domain- and WD repeat-containing protein 1 [Bagarius yarrelli]|uniref:NACHT domain-and WD repeat-containing protein 1 n=1 Tax=Bagarius yarrelli TaxID=175774 RepID=A0A556TVI6_BAGYA|nr:NACHT domain- and WD repeat-containing protein 1 [Bagarius yarrelli]
MFPFEEKAQNSSFKGNSTVSTSDTELQFLPGSILKDRWEKKDFPALQNCSIKAPHLGSSLDTHGWKDKKWNEKGHYLPDLNSVQWETNKHCHIKRRIMIYLCGGYKDTVEERTALMESVYPHLYLYCKQRGYDFKMIDLRRGVEDPVTDHHNSVQLHLEMLTKCQETKGPNFLLLTGQKHEFQSLPTTIPQKYFEAILKVLIRDRDKVSKKQPDLEKTPTKTQPRISNSTLHSSTAKSENKGNTRSTASISENTNSCVEGEKKACLERCWADFDQDLTLLLTWYRLDENTVPPVYRLLPVSTHHPDFLSRDGERRKAARKAWYFTCKQICRVLQTNGPEAIGETKTLLLDWEVEQGLGAKLPAEEYSYCYKRTITDLLFNLRSEYASQFIDLQKGRAELNHSLYQAQQNFIHNIHSKNVQMVKYSRFCYRVMQLKPVKGSYDIMRKEAAQHQIQNEIQLHLKHAQMLAKTSELRQNFLLEVRDAFQKSASSQNALLLLGEPGVGKSTILAKVTELLPTWTSGDVTVLVCFVGLTSDSRNVRLILQRLCTQIVEIYNCKYTEISESLAQLRNELHSLLALVNENRPLVLVLDGLDELAEEHDADLSWLYTHLPQHVYVILSAITKSTTAHMLQTQAKVLVLAIPPLSSEEINASLTSKLVSDFSQLQENQWSLLLRSCLFCPLPIYLRFAYVESRTWTSFSLPEQLALPGDLKSLFIVLLARLEREYGENLVRRVTSLISLSRGGVTEEELLKMLGLDRRVILELTKLYNHTSATSEYPSVPYGLLARLLWELRYHIMEVESDGTWVLCWTHIELSHVIIQRYLKTEESKRAIHTDIAEYLSCSASDSHIFQPLAWSREEDGRKNYVFNLRKLHGLPYHLIHSGQIQSLLSKCLFNYEFLLHKIWGLSVSHVEEDLKAGFMPDKELPDIHVLNEAFCLSRPVLLKDPCQLASQLLGRLLHITTQDKPVAPGHLSPVTALALGQNHIVSCSVDGTLILWKLEDSVTLANSIPCTVGYNPNCVPDALTLCLEDTVLALRMGHSLQVQEVFDLAMSCSLLHCVNLTLGYDPIHKDNSILVSHNSVKDYVLFGYRSGREAAVFSAKAGSVLVTLQAQHQAASIQAVEMTSQYFLLFCRYPYKRDDDIIHIELFSTASFQYLRSIMGCSHDYISYITINKGGTHVVAFCPSPYNRTTEINIWNLETEDHKHMTRFPGLLTGGICPDLRFCLGFCTGERHVRLWNLASRINDQSLTYNIHKVQSDGIQDIIATDKYPSYVVCRSTRPGTMRVWNIIGARFKAHPVYVEHSLFTSADVALVRDLKLYILTDLGTAPFTDTPIPVYQTLLVYDLPTKSYIKKQSGLFIVPCPEQDYRLIEGELLLGLSETRDHLIMWDLNTGYIKHRIKTNHKNSLRSSLLVSDSQPLNMPTKERSELVMPWDWRTETKTAKKRRQDSELQREREVQQCLEREKYNSIDQYLLSGNEKVVICSYFAHHLNVFSVSSQEHLHTLEDCWSLLDLRTAALTHSGTHLIISNYSEAQRAPYLTLWETQNGRVQKRLKNEPGICCVAITDDASRVVFGIGTSNKLKVWEPFKRKHKTISGYGSLKMHVSSRLYITKGGTEAILLADELSVWDLEAGTVLSVFTPDSRIQCVSVVGNEKCTVLLGFSDISTLISMTFGKQGLKKTALALAEDDARYANPPARMLPPAPFFTTSAPITSSHNTTTANVTATPTPHNTTTANVTTTTPAPHNTTTPNITTTLAPHNTTTANTTTPSTTTSPIPMPTPTTNSTVGNYTVKDGNKLCIMVQAAIQVHVNNNIQHMVGTYVIPGNASSAGNCERNSARLKIILNEGYISMDFIKNDTTNVVFVSGVAVNLSYAFKAGELSHLERKSKRVQLFSMATGHSYSCKSESVSLGNDTYLEFRQERIQAFNFTNNQFGPLDLCKPDRPNYQVAIGVGVALLILIIIVILAYILKDRDMEGIVQSDANTGTEIGTLMEVTFQKNPNQTQKYLEAEPKALGNIIAGSVALAAQNLHLPTLKACLGMQVVACVFSVFSFILSSSLMVEHSYIHYCWGHDHNGTLGKNMCDRLWTIYGHITGIEMLVQATLIALSATLAAFCCKVIQCCSPKSNVVTQIVLGLFVLSVVFSIPSTPYFDTILNSISSWTSIAEHITGIGMLVQATMIALSATLAAFCCKVIQCCSPRSNVPVIVVNSPTRSQ